MRVNILADAMKTIVNAERRGKRQVIEIYTGSPETSLKAIDQIPQNYAKAR